MNSEVWIAGASFVVSVGAFLISWRADDRSKVAARAQLFLDLRTQFLKILEDLPPSYADPDWHATDPDERAAAIRYWHHAFDEWYLTQCLNKRLMSQLWDQYYSSAMLAGLRHNGLRETLIGMTERDIVHGKLWSQFRDELARIWARHHPQDGSTCSGITCSHRAA